MDRKLEQLEPKRVFYYFEEIAKIPHGSGNIEQISNYLVSFAKEHELEYIQDANKNVIIIKEATKGYEDQPAIILQGHMDMVAVKTPECTKDMMTEGLDLEVVGDEVYAKNTSLGGDDGIAVAYALAVLEDDKLQHPRIEVIITVDEETGMTGAKEVDLSNLHGKRMINIDSEEEGFLLVGCAGGATLNGSFSFSYQEQNGILVDIVLSGLKGGHSGVEIDKERGNALYLLARLLRMIKEEVHFSLVSFQGGEKDNAIPLYSTAQILVPEEEYANFEAVFQAKSDVLKNEYISKEATMILESTARNQQNQLVLEAHSFEKFLQWMQIMPNGVQSMSGAIKELPETSLNMGILSISKETMKYTISVRSSIASAKKELVEKVKTICEMFGSQIMVKNEYPAWEYKADSPLRDQMCSLYKKMYQKDMQVLMIHAGLECGLLSEKIEGLDCVSIGPDMQDIHTPRERLNISSTKRVWEFLVAFLQNKDDN